MLIYLDTRDLIAITDGSAERDRRSLVAELNRASAALVYTMANITEVSAPLVHGGIATNVMQRLNILEEIPHRYVAEALIEPNELREACIAYLADREYSPRTPPIVRRFDYVVSPFRDPPTKAYLKFGLAQTVFELWSHDPRTVSGFGSQATQLRAVLERDRQIPNYRRHEPNFASSLGRNLHLYGIDFPPDCLPSLARWIRERPSRCPAIQLGYEVFHAMLKNVGDKSENSDIPDFSHISCVAYVDFITLDARMRDYVRRADTALGTRYTDHVRSNLAQISTSLAAVNSVGSSTH